MMRPSLVLLHLLGIDKKNMSARQRKLTTELHEYVKDTEFVLVVLDSLSQPVLTKKTKTKLKKLKDVQEYVSHPVTAIVAY